MTIIVQTNPIYGQKLYQRLIADKNLEKVIVDESEITEKDLALPGNLVSDKTLERILMQGAKGKSIPAEKSRRRAHAKLDAWKKKK